MNRTPAIFFLHYNNKLIDSKSKFFYQCVEILYCFVLQTRNCTFTDKQDFDEKAQVSLWLSGPQFRCPCHVKRDPTLCISINRDIGQGIQYLVSAKMKGTR